MASTLDAAPLKGSLARVHAAMEALGLPAEILRFPDSTRSAEEAAAAVGCSVAEIAKSLVFHASDSDRSALVIASGVNRVDPERVAAVLGEPLARADGRFVRARTGFAIGGVAPFGHKEPPLTVIDRDLFGFQAIWAAAGAPNAVVRIETEHLAASTGGVVADIKVE